MALFLLRFWPVLVPILAYLLWVLMVRRNARKSGVPQPQLQKAAWFWVMMASLAVAVVMFMIVGLSHERNSGDYVPPYLKNGQVVPGVVQP